MVQPGPSPGPGGACFIPPPRTGRSAGLTQPGQNPAVRGAARSTIATQGQVAAPGSNFRAPVGPQQIGPVLLRLPPQLHPPGSQGPGFHKVEACPQPAIEGLLIRDWYGG